MSARLLHARSPRALLLVALLAGCVEGSNETAPSLSISPASPTSADPLVANADGPLGDRWTVAWRRDGVRAVALDGQLTAPATQTARAQQWEAVLVDRIDGSEVGASEPVTILNSPPRLGEVAIDPEAPRSDEPLGLLVGGWSDADGDLRQLAVRWFVNDEEVGGGEQLAVGATRRDDEVYAEVTAFDAYGDGDALTTPAVLIGNGAPSGLAVTISPSAPGDSDALTCAISAPAVDPDGDVVSYALQWTLGGFVYPDSLPGAVGPTTTTIPGDTVPALDTEVGQSWACRVVPSDALEDGPVAVATALVTAGPVPDFSLVDQNATSPTVGLAVSPRDYLERVSGWYFGHAT